jgi:hypothetical protein
MGLGVSAIAGITPENSGPVGVLDRQEDLAATWDLFVEEKV